ncbi:HEAT repeat domain-containing protein [Streptomyces sp. NBC_01637]|uniref:HEAT repeat domain-containing protein n=1 Tax=unclassified Streptomyces TaxID=2593676 RepID=UPI0038648837|nr:HEAT repeat domain-containing protein [Streptomyces sp. NBC_01653]WTD92164.1 HEAT repeat domain-containing protein [Streptomyces sp. NBC_01637]
MINDPDDIGWTSGHLSGQSCGVPTYLKSMRSTDPKVRDQAFDDFYAEAHDQGAVDPCTAASLPFLFDMADDPATPDRARIIRLLLSIGRGALGHDPDGIYFTVYGVESTAHVDIAAEMPERAGAFLRYAADVEPLVRRPAIEAVGLFLGDGDLAVRTLAHRLTAENGIVERLLVVRTMAGLPARLPSTRPAVTAWLGALADGVTHPPIDAPTRLAALTYRAFASSDRIDAGLVPRATALLREITRTPGAVELCDGCRRCRSKSYVHGRETPPGPRAEHLAATCFDPHHPWPEHSPISSVLRSLHAALGDRAADRATLLTEQLTSADTATRYDAIEMAKDFPGSLPQDLTLLLLDLLPDPYAASRITNGLSRWMSGALTIAPEDTTTVCDALADYTAGQRAAHGPDVWGTGNALIRDAYQEAIMTLADHRDPRALPDLITALDTRVDDWRALYGVGGYPQAAHQLVPLLADGLRDIDPDRPHAPIPVGLYLSCLAELKDPIAIPVITDTLTWAIRHESWGVVASALDKLATFGPAAAPARTIVHSLIDGPDARVRPAAQVVLEAITAPWSRTYRASELSTRARYST